MSTPNPFGTDPLGLAPAKPASTTLSSGISEADKKAAEALKARTAAEQARLKEAEQKKQMLDKAATSSDEELAKAVHEAKEWKPTETLPEYEKMSKDLKLNLSKLTAPPQKELVYKAKNFKILLPILAALAALGTRSAGGNIAIGINAMGKGLQAFKEGNEEEYARQYKVWEDKTNQALKENEVEIKGYNEWLKSVQGDDKQTMGAKLGILRAMVAANRNAHMAQVTNSHDIEAISKTIDSLTEAHNKAEQRINDAKHALKPLKISKSIRDSVTALFGADKYLPPLKTIDDNNNEHINSKVALLQSRVESLAAQIQQENPNLTPAAAAAMAQVEAIQQGMYKQEGFNEPVPQSVP